MALNHETYTLICILRDRHVDTFRVTRILDDEVSGDYRVWIDGGTEVLYQ